jgi:hypothetical protein
VLTNTPNPNANRATSGVKIGLNVIPLLPALKPKATTFDKTKPRMIPATPPIKPIITDSPRKITRTVLLFMPKALSIPISRVRSIKETIIMFIMPIPATNNDMAATPPRKRFKVEDKVEMVDDMSAAEVTVT